MSWTFDFNSVDITQSVLGGEIVENLYGSDMFSVTINNANGSFDSTFYHGHDVQTDINSTNRFIGSIESITLLPSDGAISIFAREKLGEMMDIFPIESEYKDKLRSFILDDIMDKYARDVNITNIASSPSGTEITTSFKGGKSLFEVLDDFALEDGYRYYITRTGSIDYLHYEVKEQVTSSLTLSTVTDEIYDFTLPEAGQDIKNRVHIYGTQKQTGTIKSIGSAIEYPVASGEYTTIITVDDDKGTYQSGAYLDGLFVFTDPDSGKSGSAYRIVDNGDDSSNDTFTLDGDASVATGGQVATDAYNLPILWEGNDSVSQVYKGNINNTPDSTNPLIKAAQIVDNTIKTPLQAQKRAANYLNEHAWKLDTFTVLAYAQNYATLNCGELIATTLDSYVDRDMLVTGLK